MVEDLETFHFDKELRTCSDDYETCSRLPNSLNLEELVTLSSRVKIELRELLFMLDNIPSFLSDGGLNTLEKRNSIQRHKKSGSTISRTDSVKTLDPFEDMSEDEPEPRQVSKDNITNIQSSTHEKRKSIHAESVALEGLDRRKSFKSDNTFERRPSISETSIPERRVSVSKHTHQRRTSLQRDIPKTHSMERRQSLQRRESRSPERRTSFNPYMTGTLERRSSINWDHAPELAPLEQNSSMQDIGIAERRKSVQHDFLPELDSQFMNRDDPSPHLSNASPAKESTSGVAKHRVKRKEPNKSNYN